MLDNRGSQTHAAKALLPQLPDRHLQKIRDEFYLRPRHPDIPFPRPGAASAALRTLKMQTRNIPRSFFLNPGFHTRHPEGSVKLPTNIPHHHNCKSGSRFIIEIHVILHIFWGLYSNPSGTSIMTTHSH
jgi:hypothetical protein